MNKDGTQILGAEALSIYVEQISENSRTLKELSDLLMVRVAELGSAASYAFGTTDHPPATDQPPGSL